MNRAYRSSPYRRAVGWIAHNDEPTCRNLTEVKELISVQVVAYVLGVDESMLAADILEHRKENP